MRVEWNIAALGGEKASKSPIDSATAAREVAAEGLLLHGQGKWYPGEQLPRWALGCYFRMTACRSGTTSNGSREAASTTGTDCRMPNASPDGWRSCSASAKAGSCRPSRTPGTTCGASARLPVNVDPLERQARRPGRTRSAGARVSARDRGGGRLGVAAARTSNAGCRRRRLMREERCFLLPGDSPIGFRLRSIRCPWADEEDLGGGSRARSVRAARAAASSAFRFRADRRKGARRRLRRRSLASSARRRVGDGVMSHGAVRRAARGIAARLHAAHAHSSRQYVELVAAIERTARDSRLPGANRGLPAADRSGPGALRGDARSRRARGQHPPARTSRELVAQHRPRSTPARASASRARSSSSTGARPAPAAATTSRSAAPPPTTARSCAGRICSRSLLAFAQHHPSLSYLFTGLFVGPTSQAPRIDEARHDALYELEIALPAASGHAGAAAAVAGRRALPPPARRRHRQHAPHRDLHRQAVRSPTAPAGGRGWSSFARSRCRRTPRWRSRSISSCGRSSRASGRAPYRAPLVRWGKCSTIGSSCRTSSGRTSKTCSRHASRPVTTARTTGSGRSSSSAFRCSAGRAGGDVELELRNAIEPWHVLGEEAPPAGTARYVDSSIERVEVRAFGLTEGATSSPCNGLRLPLHATGTAGKHVGGVRFRAWQPPSCSAADLGIHHPLHIEVVDSWRTRARRVHVPRGAPGRTSATDRPVNAAAAESRRIARFDHMGHVPGPFRGVADPAALDPPFTLDLRRDDRRRVRPGR